MNKHEMSTQIYYSLLVPFFSNTRAKTKKSKKFPLLFKKEMMDGDFIPQQRLHILDVIFDLFTDDRAVSVTFLPVEGERVIHFSYIYTFWIYYGGKKREKHFLWGIPRPSKKKSPAGYENCLCAFIITRNICKVI